MTCVYVLKLISNKYYVGKTNNPNFRLEQHFNSNGSNWTKKYKPIKIIEIINNCDDFDEDKYTLKYMGKFGIQNVRGGSFCETILNKNNILTITKMLDSSTDKCYICGKKNHFAKDCIYEEIEYESSDDDYTCFKCGRIGHFANECYAKTTVNGKQSYGRIVGNNKCYRCGREGHFANECYAKTHSNGYYLE